MAEDVADVDSAAQGERRGSPDRICRFRLEPERIPSFSVGVMLAVISDSLLFTLQMDLMCVSNFLVV